MSRNPLTDTLSADVLRAEAQREWDSKSEESKLKKGKTYSHIFIQRKFKYNDWLLPFDKLTRHQRNILIKGVLIRKYDALDNKTKTLIKENFGLSAFSSKWYRLPSADKKKMLKIYLHNG